ncbi:hypothetical protein M8818_004765 [Zalaria obscura]|uniref:Uncharacterized protein n=1 Tax=Zalaria obscura TaxID=2024903 RepID=A0ACC3SCG3_9PEZI
MSPITSQLSFLALASSALAVPFFAGHGHHHHHLHSGRPVAITGTGAPYALANETGIYGPTGSGFATGSGLPVGTGIPSAGFPHPSVVGPATVSADTLVASASSSSTTSCTDSVVYVTSTNRVTSTVLAEKRFQNHRHNHRTTTLDLTTTVQVTASSAAPVETSETSTISSVAAVETSETSTTSSTSTSESSTSSVYVAPTTTSSSVAASTSATSTSASATASTTADAASSGGKRGLAYNDASLTTCFDTSSLVGWAYNWASSASGTLSSNYEYVPLLWGTSSDFTDSWSTNAQAAIDAGSTHLMGFNEPDLSSQSNLSPSEAASAWKTYMEPFAGKAKLGAPAVTNGGGAMGLTWLSEFLDACSDCTIDFVSIHWYDSYSNTAYFQDQVNNATSVAGGKPVWVTEFGTTDGTDDQIASFLETVMPWMDSQDFVERYAYFMASDGILLTGTEPSSPVGTTYMDYTS